MVSESPFDSLPLSLSRYVVRLRNKCDELAYDMYTVYIYTCNIYIYTVYTPTQ